MKAIVEEANKLGGVGWEMVGIASADKTVGFNSNIVVLKRPISAPPARPDSDEDWQPDPTGRFDKRRWDAVLGVWTAETAMMEAKSMHVDPPHMVKPVM